MFYTLIKSALLHKAQTWGWNEYQEIEQRKGTSVKWSLGLYKRTPGYVLREKPLKG